MNHFRKVLDEGPWENMFFYKPAQLEVAPVRTLADMSEEEIVALEKQYGCPVRRPNRDGTASEGSRVPATILATDLPPPEDLGGELVGLLDWGRHGDSNDEEPGVESRPRRRRAA